MRLRRLDSQKVKTALAAWCVRMEAESRCGEEPSRLVVHPSERHDHLARDGKAGLSTGKPADGGEEPPKQVVQVDEVDTGMVLQQSPMATQYNAREYAQALVDASAKPGAHSDPRCRPELSREWRVWSSVREARWLCSSKTIQEPPVPT
jgi:hypothetical protein